MINHSWRVWLRVFIFWIPIAVQAQVQTFGQALVWTRYNVRWQMRPNWALHLEADNRLFIQPSYGAHQFIAHLHIHRRFLRNQEIWGGFSFSRVAAQRPEIEGLAMAEYRVWQAFSVRNKVFQHRLRTEQRFFPESNSGGLRVAFRMRYALTAQIKICGPFSLKFGDEIMVQQGRGIQKWFDQNRIWGGFEIAGSQDRWGIELLYLWLTQQNAAGNTWYDRDVLRFTLSQQIGTKK